MDVRAERHRQQIFRYKNGEPIIAERHAVRQPSRRDPALVENLAVATNVHPVHAAPRLTELRVEDPGRLAIGIHHDTLGEEAPAVARINHRRHSTRVEGEHPQGAVFLRDKSHFPIGRELDLPRRGATHAEPCAGPRELAGHVERVHLVLVGHPRFHERMTDDHVAHAIRRGGRTHA